jgi:hypothetical protein
MLKIEGDPRYFQVSTNSAYIDGQQGVKVNIGPSYDLDRLLRSFELMESTLLRITAEYYEYQEFKKHMNSNPALQANWKEFQTFMALAKEAV